MSYTYTANRCVVASPFIGINDKAKATKETLNFRNSNYYGQQRKRVRTKKTKILISHTAVSSKPQFPSLLQIARELYKGKTEQVGTCFVNKPKNWRQVGICR